MDVIPYHFSHISKNIIIITEWFLSFNNRSLPTAASRLVRLPFASLVYTECDQSILLDTGYSRYQIVASTNGTVTPSFLYFQYDSC